jgi:ATP-dependent DNA helicase RecG
VVNAVCTSSYRIHGATQIIRYAKPAGDPQTRAIRSRPKSKLASLVSETRNPRIAAVLHEVNIAETKEAASARCAS